MVGLYCNNLTKKKIIVRRSKILPIIIYYSNLGCEDHSL